MESRGIPQKLYYRIGEVAEIVGVKPHVLRYWESEFPFLSPRKSDGNQRLYTHQDLEKVRLIKKLLYEERFTISGVKRKFREIWKTERNAPRAGTRKQLLARLRADAEEVLRILGQG
ncbi:MerR family transcriptional regulator [Deferrisoma palaeochoriense]